MESLQSNSKRQPKDLITPHKISVLIFIREVCKLKNRTRQKGGPASGRTEANTSSMNEDDDDRQASNTHTGAFDSSPQKREFAITILELIQGSDVDLPQLLSKVQSTCSPHLFNAVLERIRKISSKGISELMDFVQSLETLLVDPNHQIPVVHKSSVIGLFVRRMMLVFDKLSFGQMTTLYHHYQRHCSHLLTVSVDDEVGNILDSDGSCRSVGANETLPTSLRQAELFVARQVALLQTNERAAVEPSELQSRIKQMLVANPNLPEAHFLNLMNCLRVKEYCGAVNALHRAFDCGTANNDASKADDTSRNLRFAALNLGSLLCSFGYREEALLALREATTMAREVNDNVCLQHALSWLYRLEKERKDTLVERSITKTGELNIPYLTSLGILTFAQMKASTVAKPALIFDFLRKCDILNCQHSILELMTQSYSQKSSLWNAYGKKQMTLLSTQLLLHLNMFGSFHCGEAFCRALCQLAVLFSKEGKYDRAELILSLAKKTFPTHTPHSTVWMFFEQTMNYERALRRCEWHDAEVAVSNLATLNMDESKIKRAELYFYRGETTKSLQLLNKMISENSHQKDSEYRVRLLVLLGQCHCQRNSPSMAIMPLSSALTLAQQFHLVYWEAVTSLHLAFVQYMMGYPRQAINLMDATKVHLLTDGTVYDRARTLFLHAKCSVANVKATVADGSFKGNGLTVMREAAIKMGTAANYFLQTEAFHRAKDAYYEQALLYDLLGDTEERNRASFQFRNQQSSVFLDNIL